MILMFFSVTTKGSWRTEPWPHWGKAFIGGVIYWSYELAIGLTLSTSARLRIDALPWRPHRGEAILCYPRQSISNSNGHLDFSLSLTKLSPKPTWMERRPQAFQLRLTLTSMGPSEGHQWHFFSFPDHLPIFSALCQWLTTWYPFFSDGYCTLLISLQYIPFGFSCPRLFLVCAMLRHFIYCKAKYYCIHRGFFSADHMIFHFSTFGHAS